MVEEQEERTGLTLCYLHYRYLLKHVRIWTGALSKWRWGYLAKGHLGSVLPPLLLLAHFSLSTTQPSPPRFCRLPVEVSRINHLRHHHKVVLYNIQQLLMFLYSQPSIVSLARYFYFIWRHLFGLNLWLHLATVIYVCYSNNYIMIN